MSALLILPVFFARSTNSKTPSNPSYSILSSEWKCNHKYLSLEYISSGNFWSQYFPNGGFEFENPYLPSRICSKEWRYKLNRYLRCGMPCRGVPRHATVAWCAVWSGMLSAMRYHFEMYTSSVKIRININRHSLDWWYSMAQWVNEWVNEWMNDSRTQRTNEWASEWMNIERFTGFTSK